MCRLIYHHFFHFQLFLVLYVHSKDTCNCQSREFNDKKNVFIWKNKIKYFVYMWEKKKINENVIREKKKVIVWKKNKKKYLNEINVSWLWWKGNKRHESRQKRNVCCCLTYIRTHTGLGLTTVVLLGVLHLKLMWLCKNFSKKNER